MNGCTMELSIYRADGGAGYSLTSINNGGHGAGSIRFAKPVASGNDVIFSILTSNNGTGSTYQVATKVEVIGNTDNNIIYSEIAGSTAGGGSDPGTGHFFYANGVELAGLEYNETTFNEDSNDKDFRVESNSNSHALFLDAAEDKFRLFTTNVSFSDSRFQVEGPNDGWCVGLDVNATNSGRGAIGISIASGSAARVLRVDKVGVGTIGFINQSDSGLTYTTTSDRRLKDNIQTITDGTDKLMAMNPVTHGWKADPEADTVHGFIAQEMQEIVPEAVSGDPESDEMMSMDYGRITPVLVAALQDAHKKIMELEERINELEGK